MARRFIVEDNDVKRLENEDIVITGSEVKHIQVLRYNIGDKVVVNNGIYAIKEMSREDIKLSFLSLAPLKGIPKTNIVLYLAFLKNDKMDFVVQKAVELGVKNIVPFFSTNVVVKLDEKARLKRREKLQKIADEACKQCGRMDKVKVLEFINFSDLKGQIIHNDVNLFAYESSKESLKYEIDKMKSENSKNIGIIIGAEGGFTINEATMLKEIPNVKCVSLGERILRAETAALSLISIVEYEMEE